MNELENFHVDELMNLLKNLIMQHVRIVVIKMKS